MKKTKTICSLGIKDNIIEQLKYNKQIIKDMEDNASSNLNPFNVIKANTIVLKKTLKLLGD